MTFEDAAIARLRRKKGPRQAFRDQVTRAEFVTTLARDAEIPCISPWRGVERPIKKNKAVGVRVLDEGRGSGIDRTARLTVKGVRANSTQIDMASRALQSTYDQFPDAPRRAVLALLCALTHESVMGTQGMTTATISDNDSVGPLQARLAYVSEKDAVDIDYNVRRFMVDAWTGNVDGAIKQAEAGNSIGEICMSVQGNDTGDVYTQWKDEAEKWLEAFGGGGLSYEITTEVRYAFQVKKDESYWDAIKRLAKEVGWRAFVSNGKLYFMTDSQLLRSRPRLRIKSDHAKRGTKNYTPGIDSVSFDLASNKKTNSVQIAGRHANTWQAPPGTVVILENFGHANGRWLVSDIETDLTNEDFVAKLKRPAKPLPEPAPETRTRTVRGRSNDREDGGGSTDALARVYIGPNNSPGAPWWGGTLPIFRQFVIPFMAERGLTTISSRKRPENSGTGTSDHWVASTSAYACDFPTGSGEGQARELAAAMGYSDWAPDTEIGFTIRVDGFSFSAQIIWGAAVDHGDHVHVGIHRV
ncbi:MAG TPA: hypothetical protein VMF31_03270 [Solirubrobacterales bacterium]|nr:hypothetical protein [Solirubrobacterales bacterium]